MGVPKLYRWLSKKYPLINQQAVEEKPIYKGKQKTPVDISKPNPNNEEFDNLYIDMNGVIHPCTHPTNKPAPETEDEMLIEIFAYIDRIMSVVRLRKVLYLAIDGVAPRAKMNQQRSRRFRAAQEMVIKKDELDHAIEYLKQNGRLDDNPDSKESFDSNCITPGTIFMDKISKALKFYVCNRITNDPGWENLTVIFSDSNVPGEGEHKIIEFIRHQKSQIDYDPNTKHILHGADADLIMLGLATHEPYFTILREEFKPSQAKPCEICGQYGHSFQNCEGMLGPVPKQSNNEIPTEYDDTNFIFIKLHILRMYLTQELLPEPKNKNLEIEKIIDDWIFICFFIGNDFLPNLPSLDINEGAIDRLVRIYKNILFSTNVYLTDHGIVNFDQVSKILKNLGSEEDIIFQRRYQREMDYKARNQNQNKFDTQAAKPRDTLQAFLVPENNKNQNLQGSFEEKDKNEDTVLFHEEGWKERYYIQKFGIKSEEIDEFSQDVAFQYCKGLSWVLLYYFRGCPSWKWFYPYHYAPFSSDFKNVEKLNFKFPSKTEPFKPMDQLMAVLPSQSRQLLPLNYQNLMVSKESPIIKYYPIDFKVDLNGKRFAWQGVVLLPFISEKELISELRKLENTLNEEENLRNSLGKAQIFAKRTSKAGNEILKALEAKKEKNDEVFVNKNGIDGILTSAKDSIPEKNFESKLKCVAKLQYNRAAFADYQNPRLPKDYVYSSTMLDGAKLPENIIKKMDSKESPQRHNNYRNDYRYDANYKKRNYQGQKDSSYQSKQWKYG